MDISKFNRSKRLTLDLETTVNNIGKFRIGKFAANPFHPENRIVSIGVLKDANYWSVYSDRLISPTTTYDVFLGIGNIYNYYLVGHNLKFDLQYLRKADEDYYYELIKHCMVWDTMTVEYLLSGQQDKFISLDECIERYNLPNKKDGKISEYWEAGVKTEDIPKEELLDYMRNDVEMTDLLYLRQYDRVNSLGMLPLIHSQMEALLALTEMEYNGCFLNINRAEEYAEPLNKKIHNLVATCNEFLRTKGIPNPNCNSSKQISLALFGGYLTEQIKVPDLDENGVHKKFKSGLRVGQLRYKNGEREVLIEGEYTPKEEWLGKDGQYSTAEEVLKTLSKQQGGATSFLSTILELRGLVKDLGTYYIGYMEKTWDDGLLHPNFNTTKTNTGRLSCTSPNMQNLTSSED